jgi:exopolysaccharide biosynthesis polyprenyl glycosylphosphotransferase
MFKRDSLTYLLFFSIDILLTISALQLAKWLREIIPLGVYLDEPLVFSPWLYLIVPLVWIVVFGALRVYSPTRSLHYASAADLPAVWGAIIGASLIFAGIAYLLFRELSRFLFFYFLILELILLSSWRWLLPRFPALARRLYRADQRRVLIVGAGSVGQELARAMINHSLPNLTLVGFADDETKMDYPAKSDAGIAAIEQSQSCLGYPILGGMDDVPRLVREYQLQEVIFALPPAKQADLRTLVMALHTTPVNLRLVPDVFDLIFLQASVETFEGIPLIGLREPAIQGLDRLIKRLFDITVSIFLLIILAPLMALFALLIKLDSAGPVFFRQQRVGEGGRLFWMYKFRSMVDGADKAEPYLVQKTTEGLPTLIKTPGDSRITPLGHFFRRTSLDELPQLFNVLKGEMSLVGPRPELPWVVERYELWQRKRFAVPQGMTGWWQVNGRMNRATPQERAEDDLFYIKNYSFWLDLRILWKTIQAVILGDGAY